MFLRNVILGIYGLCAGGVIAASFLAFLSMIGIIPRLATSSKAAKYALTYETAITLGGIIGSTIYIFEIPIPFGKWILVIWGIFGGIFIGCLIAALAELLKSLPVLSKRLELKQGISFAVYGIAFGKVLGCYLQFWN